jgi:hypothetical protein
MNRQIMYLFIVGLLIDAFNFSDYTASNGKVVNEYWIGKVVEGNMETNLMYCPGICLEGLRKSTKVFSQDSPYTRQDLKTGPSEYKQQR